MKKVLFALLLIFLFMRCEKENEKSEHYFLNGEWTLHLSNLTGETISWFVCFDVDVKDGTKINSYYFCDKWVCFDENPNYILELFDFRFYDSTLLIKTIINSPDNYGGKYMYYGKYDKGKDVFIGATYYAYPENPDAYYMCSNDDSITRGIIK